MGDVDLSLDREEVLRKLQRGRNKLRAGKMVTQARKRNRILGEADTEIQDSMKELVEAPTLKPDEPPPPPPPPEEPPPPPPPPKEPPEEPPTSSPLREECRIPMQGEAPKFGLLHVESPDRFSLVADPLGLYPATVLRATTFENDQLQWSGNPRTEGQGHTKLIRAEEVVAWGTYVHVPANFPKVDGWMSLASLYGMPAGHESPIRIEVKGDRLGWQRSTLYGYDIPWQLPTGAHKGKWVGVKVEELLSLKGWVRIWYRVVGAAGGWQRVTFFPGSSKETQTLAMNTIDQVSTPGSQHVKIMQYRKKGMSGFAPTTGYSVYFTGLYVGDEHSSIEAPLTFKG